VGGAIVTLAAATVGLARLASGAQSDAHCSLLTAHYPFPQDAAARRHTVCILSLGHSDRHGGRNPG